MRFVRIASDMRRSWDRFRANREAIRRLSELDDRQLDDIGVSRREIGEFVRKGER